MLEALNVEKALEVKAEVERYAAEKGHILGLRDSRQLTWELLVKTVGEDPMTITNENPVGAEAMKLVDKILPLKK